MLRRHLREFPRESRALARELRGVRWEERADFDHRSVRFGFVGNASTANLGDATLLESLSRGILPIQYHAPSSVPSRELRDPGSDLYRHNPDVVIVATSPAAHSAPDEEYVDDLIESVRFFRERSPAILLVHGLVMPECRVLGVNDWQDAVGPAETTTRLNLTLAERLRDIPAARFIDLAHALALSGASWWTLHRSWFLARAGVSEDVAPILARQYAAVGAALRGLVRKCLVVDLDDTLWGGVVGEIGANQVQIGSDYPGSVYRAIQDIVRQLHDSGVLLAINSHNTEDEAWEPFRSRSEMVLERRHIAAWRINWRDKAENLRDLSRELNLDLDSFVVLENDSTEQAWIEEALPQVHVIGAADPLDMVRLLATQRLFDGLSHTAEDRLRARSQQASGPRREAELAAVDRSAFLGGLGLTVHVGSASAHIMSRLAQLSERVNQFNPTTRRYTESQLAEMSASTDTAILWCSCRDRFGDDGIVGMVAVRGSGEEWVVDSLLLSCRVLGKGIEHALLAAACRVLERRGVRRVRGEFIRSARNAPASDVYRSAGFTEVEATDDRSVWRLELPAPDSLVPGWITLTVEDGIR